MSNAISPPLLTSQNYILSLHHRQSIAHMSNHFFLGRIPELELAVEIERNLTTFLCLLPG